MKKKISSSRHWLTEIVLTVRHRIDEFIRKEDALYYADPRAYCRRTDWFWARVAMVLSIVFFLFVLLAVA